MVDASFFDSNFEFFTTTISTAPEHFWGGVRRMIPRLSISAADRQDEMFVDVPYCLRKYCCSR